MDPAVELEEIMGREAWAIEDCRRLQEVLRGMSEPARRFREMLSEQLRAEPHPSGTLAVKLGIGRYMLCAFSEALELLARGTDNKERRFYQALCCKQLRRWDEALENLGRAEDRGLDPRQVNLQTVEVQCLAGEVDAAARSLQRFAKSSQEDPDWRCVAGMVAEMQGEYDAATASYDRARQLHPAHPGATFRLAYFCDLHGEEAEAIKLYRECIDGAEAAEPGQAAIYANALMNLAVLYEDAGRYDPAEQCLRRVLSANPAHARARLFLKDVRSSRTMVFDEEEAKRVARRDDLLAIPITDFELSVRARNCLKKMNIRTLGDLLMVTEQELLSYKNFGETSLAEIKTVLTSKGLAVGQMREDVPEQAEVNHVTGATVGNEGVLATPISQIELSVRARRALQLLGVNTLGDLAGKTEAELLNCRNFGQTSLDEVRQRLAEYGMSLREGD